MRHHGGSNIIKSSRGTGPVTLRQPWSAPVSPGRPAGANARFDEEELCRSLKVSDAVSARATYPAEALHVCEWCFGPLEVAVRLREDRGRRSPGSASPGVRARSGATPICSRPMPPGAVSLGGGFTPLVRADRLAAELGLGELWIKNDALNPTGSFKGSRRLGGADQSPRARLQSGGVCVHGQPGQLGRGPRRPRRDALRRLHPLQPRVGQGRGQRRLRRRRGSRSRATTTTSTACVPSWPRSSRSGAFANINIRTYYGEGLQDARLRGGRAAGLAGARPRRRPDRLGEPADQDRQGLQASSHTVGLLDEAPSVRISGRPGRRVLAGGDGVRRAGTDVVPAGAARHHRQVGRHRRPGRRPLRPRRGPGAAAGPSTR